MGKAPIACASAEVGERDAELPDEPHAQSGARRSCGIDDGERARTVCEIRGSPQCAVKNHGWLLWLEGARAPYRRQNVSCAKAPSSGNVSFIDRPGVPDLLMGAARATHGQVSRSRVDGARRAARRNACAPAQPLRFYREGSASARGEKRSGLTLALPRADEPERT